MDREESEILVIIISINSSGEARETDMFSLLENLGVVAALQRCPTPRLLAGIRLRGLSIVPIC